jgi:hypothetical protein
MELIPPHFLGGTLRRHVPMEEAMTQSDAEHGEPVGEPEAGDQHVRLTKEEDVTDYLGQLLEQLRHVEDNINKFAIQNYAASGAVVLAYLADKAPLWAPIIIVALLNINFAIAIFVQATRVDKLFTMHCIVRDFWLENQPALLSKLRANKASSEVLATTTFPRWVAIVILLAQFLPILFLLLVAPFNEYMAYPYQSE